MPARMARPSPPSSIVQVAGSGTASTTLLAAAQYTLPSVSKVRKDTEVKGWSEKKATNESCEAFDSVNVSLSAPDTALKTMVRPGVKEPNASVPKKFPPKPCTPDEKPLKVMASLATVPLSQISLPLPDGQKPPALGPALTW